MSRTLKIKVQHKTKNKKKIVMVDVKLIINCTSK